MGSKLSREGFWFGDACEKKKLSDIACYLIDIYVWL